MFIFVVLRSDEILKRKKRFQFEYCTLTRHCCTIIIELVLIKLKKISV